MSVVLALALLLPSAEAHPIRVGQFDMRHVNTQAVEFVEAELPKTTEQYRSKLFTMPELESILARVRDRITHAPGNEIYFRGVETRIHVLEGASRTAFTTPKGDIYISGAALQALGSEEQIAAILAHEMAHVSRRHNYRNIERMLEMRDRANAPRSGAMRALLGTVDFFDVRSLSREFEFEADHIALEMLDNARIDPREFPKALQRVMDGADGERAAPRRPSLLERAVNRCSTHPLTCRRVESVTAEIAEMDRLLGS